MTLLIFDCDGVLVDSESILIAAEMEFLAAFGLDLDRSEYQRRFTGTSLRSWEGAVSDLLTSGGRKAPTPGEFARFAEETDRRVKAGLKAIEGAAGFVSKLDCPMCVASSSTPSQLEWKLARAGLKHFFAGRTFSSSEVRKGKPAPDLFLFAASRMRAVPEGCVVIEDSSSGIRAAKEAGMAAIGLTAGAHCLPEHGARLLQDGADFVAQTYVQLADYLDIG